MKPAVIAALDRAPPSCSSCPHRSGAVPADCSSPALLIVHAIECLVFLPRLRAAGGSLGHHLVQTLLFGFLHVRAPAGGVTP